MFYEAFIRRNTRLNLYLVILLHRNADELPIYVSDTKEIITITFKLVFDYNKL